MSTRVIVTPDENGNNPSVQIAGSTIMQPVDIQNHLQTTIQTHNAVSVAASGSSTNASWIDANGYTEIGFTALNDSGTTNFGAAILWSNDGVNIQGAETLLASGVSTSANSRSGGISTRARYFKIAVTNGDGAAAHTMSAWAYLKA